MRRLSRVEYINTVRDLLGVDVDLNDLLPLESPSEGFDNSAESLHVSSYLLENAISLGHHDLSHHGKDPGKLEQLQIVEQETIKTVRDLLAKLKGTPEGEANLLDRTMVFFGSNLGDASSHSVKNLPVLLCGGGFRHGHLLSFDPQNPPPLCNLYVSMLQRLGIDVDRFSTSTGTLTGLESLG